jgi:dipeptidyl aminopeptidase/acylaminoacyl peptidase
MTDDDLLNPLLGLPSISSAYLSPDGRYVAFSWYRRHPNLDVFLLPVDGSHPPLPLTRSSEATRLVGWAPGSRSVVVARDRAGDERFQLFRVDIDQPERMHPLTEPCPPYFLRGGSLSPGGRYLYYSANFDAETGRTIEPTWVYRHDLQTGEHIPLARPLRAGWVEPALNLQGTRLVYGRRDRHPSGRQFHLVELSDPAGDREILNFGDDRKVFARWFPDGERLAVLAETGSTPSQRYERLGIYSVQSGETRWIVDDPRRAIQSVWVSRGGQIIVNEVLCAQRRPTLIDPETGIETPFPQLGGNLLPLGNTPDGAWIGLFYAAHAPEEIVRFNFEPGRPPEMQPLTRVWEKAVLASSNLARAEDFRWHSFDGLEVQGWLYRAVPNRQRAILHIHGGPSSHAENRLYPQIQYLVSRGFNVLSVNYRGSTGFDLMYREKIKEDGWGGREQEDITSAACALLDAGLAEPGRIGVTGTSYGGYSAWCQVTRTPPELIAAAAPICGMTDLTVDYETTRPDLRSYIVEMMGGTPAELPEKYRQRSPLNFIENIRARLLIVQGANDPNVTPENVRQVRAGLDAHTIPYEILVFEDEGHGIYRPHNQAVLYRKLADFFGAALH